MVVLLMSIQIRIKLNQYNYALSHDAIIIGVFLKWHLEYKSPYMLKNVRPNMGMVILQNLIEM